ncbi:MAG: response regulator, partial [Gammaproteobacteria bacterium]|nr:response regulator [Gammaproteobacteria bacterium]
MIKVLLADDHELVRKGIRKILESAGDIEVVGEADTGEQALELVPKLQPDICIMDKFMPGIGGFEASRRILAKGSAKIICLTVYSDMPLPRKILELGAQGYLTKNCTPDEIIDAVRRVDRNERYISPVIAQRLADESLRKKDLQSPMNTLSERELQVLMMIVQGNGNQDISDIL